MKKAVWLVGILVVVFIFFGGKNGECSQSPEGKGEQKVSSNVDRDLAIKFLRGIQNGDKKMMYEAANLTTKIVNDSREKLVHSKKYKLNEQQRTEYEHALRISGQIDFFVAKTRKMFPKSSHFEITQSMSDNPTNDFRKNVHLVKITYTKKEEAMRDKTKKPVKEMVVHLQQLTRSVVGRSIYEFSFTSKDFDKIADRDFEVLSYF